MPNGITRGSSYSTGCYTRKAHRTTKPSVLFPRLLSAFPHTPQLTLPGMTPFHPLFLSVLYFSLPALGQQIQVNVP